MRNPPEIGNMALFCDLENVALGVRELGNVQFDIRKVLERLLLKGSIVVKKAYCDWNRYKDFKAKMHEAAFELIEIPHVRQSGKNSADIRMVVDALDLCYTKSHVDTFVIISGDSDFSPLVSKLRENDKYVIGIGVRESTSDLLSANCDEFIFYDDLIRQEEVKRKRGGRKAAATKAPTSGARAGAGAASGTAGASGTAERGAAAVADGDGAGSRGADTEAQSPRAGDGESTLGAIDDERRQQAIDLLVGTVEELVAERGEDDKIWASMVKQTMKRRHPGFAEGAYGYRTFKELVADAHARGLLVMGPDERSGQYSIRLPIEG